MDPLSELKARLEAVLGERAEDEVAVSRVAPLAGGACQDNFRVDLTVGGQERRMVLRSDAPSHIPGSLGRRDEFAVIEAAVGAGVRTPAVRWLMPDLLREGAHAYCMDWADGVAIGRKVLKSAELEQARSGLAEELAKELARIHSIEPEAGARIEGLRGLDREDARAPTDIDPVVQAIAFCREGLDAMHEPHPALELALRWLQDNPPEGKRVTLVHGDFRTGNFLVAPGGLSAILDWEFAHWGAPEYDLAWVSVRDWRFGNLDRPIGGFARRDAFYDAYEAASRHAVDRAAVHWWEVLGNVRWAAGSVFQAERYLSGEQKDLELLAIGRRAAEMELEALRLIEVGPGGGGRS